MIQDITKRWRSSGPWSISLPMYGSLGGLLSRVNHPDGREEKWIFGIDGEIRSLAPAEAAAIVAGQAEIPHQILEGEVMSSAAARPADAARSEELFDEPLTPLSLLYREGDFLVRIAACPGQDRFGRFSVELEIAVSDADGWYIVHREETRNWKEWPKALRWLMGEADKHINRHIERTLGLDGYSCDGEEAA